MIEIQLLDLSALVSRFRLEQLLAMGIISQ